MSTTPGPDDWLHEWLTIPEVLKRWRGAPGYDSLFRLIKRSKIETGRRGKFLTLRMADLQAYLMRQHDAHALAQMIRGDWYTRASTREQQRRI